MSDIYDSGFNTEAYKRFLKLLGLCLQLLFEISIGTLLYVLGEQCCRGRLIVSELSLLRLDLGFVLLCLFSKFDAGLRVNGLACR